MKTTTGGTNSLSRREALKTLGAGAALLGLGMISTRVIAGDSPAPAMQATVAPTQPFALPKLGYAFDALEPHIDAHTMEIHYTKHHQAYITNANKALADYPDLQKLSAGEILKNLDAMPEKIRTTLRNNVGGHANHTFFWEILTSHGTDAMSSNSQLSVKFPWSDFNQFKKEFAAEALKRFGSGWTWLSAKPDGSLVIHSTANQDSPLSEGLSPVVGLDVWEHAYYLHYQNRRADYVAAFWNVVNWTQAAVNYAAAISKT